MRRIGLAAILALSLALAPLAAETQQAAPSQPRQVGWLGVVAGPPLQDEFRRGMRELGHVEGSTYSLHERYAGNRAEALPELAAELARLKLDVIVAETGAAARAGMRSFTETARTAEVVLGRTNSNPAEWARRWGTDGNES